jgi:hypothetical protein
MSRSRKRAGQSVHVETPERLRMTTVVRMLVSFNYFKFQISEMDIKAIRTN